jgi:hypothetical protein
MEKVLHGTAGREKRKTETEMKKKQTTREET